MSELATHPFAVLMSIHVGFLSWVALYLWVFRESDFVVSTGLLSRGEWFGKPDVQAAESFMFGTIWFITIPILLGCYFRRKRHV